VAILPAQSSRTKKHHFWTQKFVEKDNRGIQTPMNNACFVQCSHPERRSINDSEPLCVREGVFEVSEGLLCSTGVAIPTLQPSSASNDVPDSEHTVVPDRMPCFHLLGNQRSRDSDSRLSEQLY
jgi:hypothetical protein